MRLHFIIIETEISAMFPCVLKSITESVNVQFSECMNRVPFWFNYHLEDRKVYEKKMHIRTPLCVHIFSLQLLLETFFAQINI
jgi:hypothetical protein